MPPKGTSNGTAARGRPKGSKNQKTTARSSKQKGNASSDDPFASSEYEEEEEDEPTERAGTSRRTAQAVPDEDEDQPEKTIPRDLLTRLLHEFFAKDATRISKDANAAVGKYVDVFVREAIARTAVEKRSGFLEVDDLEKVTPQLLLDL